MHKITFNIDWFTAVTDEINEARMGLPGIAKSLIPANGRWGYDRGYTDEIQGYTRLSSSTRRDMGICYVFSANALDCLCRSGEYQDRLSALKAFGATWGKCTRLDLCLDVHDAGLLAYVVADLADKQAIEARSKKVTVIRNIPTGSGVTVYLGARTSPSFIRVYDKNAESNGAYPATRFELECKGEIAEQIAHLMFSGTSSATLEDVILGSFLGLSPRGIAQLLTIYSTALFRLNLQAERIAKQTQKLGLSDR